MFNKYNTYGNVHLYLLHTKAVLEAIRFTTPHGTRVPARSSAEAMHHVLSNVLSQRPACVILCYTG